MGVRHATREELNRLNCSPFEAEAVIEVVHEVYGAALPGRIPLVVVDAEEPADIGAKETYHSLEGWIATWDSSIVGGTAVASGVAVGVSVGVSVGVFVGVGVGVSVNVGV